MMPPYKAFCEVVTTPMPESLSGAHVLPNTVVTFQDLLTWCHQKWRKQPSEVLKALGGGTAQDYQRGELTELRAQLIEIWGLPS